MTTEYQTTEVFLPNHIIVIKKTSLEKLLVLNRKVLNVFRILKGLARVDGSEE